MKSFLTMILGVICVSGCALLDPPGCEHDEECKGNRVCSYNECVDPSEVTGPSSGPGYTEGPTCGDTVVDCNCQYVDAYDGQAFATDACDSGYGIVTTAECPQNCYEFPTWQVICGC